MITRRTLVIQNGTQGVQEVAPPARRVANLDRLSWDNLRLFLIVAEAGSFRAAANTAGVSLNTIRTKIERLERQIGGPLFRRSVEGVMPTQDGHELVSIAREMRALGRTTERVQRGATAPRTSQVRITATEGVGTFWLIPRLVEFQGSNPDIRVDLNCEMKAPDVLFRDVDIAVQLVPPTSPDLIVQRVATLHLMPFASESYLRTHGTPTSIADAAKHKLVWQEADQVSSDLLSAFVDPKVRDTIIAVKTNTSSAHYWAVAKGAGIGFLPTYARALSRSTRPLNIGLHLRRDVYLVHHPDSVRFPEVRKALDWLRESFDKTKFPWFADEFIHPDEFEARFSDSVVVNLFEGFISPHLVEV
ncbi:LysR family transcriptional regulator [Sphingomonas paeninsulae]|jgi:DNA-binding transcriptional LysR family regulator|uniref:LysR family transcriptional regulator n=1 Tax=Sphingomonas paeninsulae TaxID=2319844 RepID=A0A494TLV8_SPHPE|nr:LysR family transcriptional regulator [Sphingomonas paeninsulae]AYJ86801.1 LysR family transcriptional regulator [Sphingomonas paeninsulae]